MAPGPTRAAAASLPSAMGRTTASSLAPSRRRNVRLTDRKLVELAVQTASSVDWSELERGGDDGPGFAATVASGESDATTRVTACGRVVGSVAEVRSVLRPPSSEAFAATMRELHGSEFIYGAIVHRVGSSTDPAAAGGGGVAHRVRQRRAGGAVTTSTADVDVRTVTFAKRHLLARSEQWCFVDALHTLELGGGAGEDRGFAASMTSLHPDDVFVGKTKASVSAFTNVHVTYTVRPVRAKRGSCEADTARAQVQVAFRAEVDGSGLTASKPRHLPVSKERMHFWRSASERALLRRLTDMAASTQQLGRIIRRRRLSAQVFVDVAALQPPNSRCSCCTKLLATILGRNKKQCHLCGFFVCEQCSRREEVARGRVRNFLVRVCEHCLERVDDGIYDHLPSEPGSPLAILGDDEDAEHSTLRWLLQDALLRSSDAQKPAVKAVIRAVAALDTPSSSASGSSDEELLLLDASPDGEYLDALQRLNGLAGSSPGDFALANAAARTYPIQYKPGAGVACVPEAPVPADEQQRLRWVERADVPKLKNLPELELICDMARKELGCSTALVTLATRDEFHVLASNEPTLRHFVNPRGDAICAHVLMDPARRPVLLPHPEADVRFSRQNMVRDFGTRFYFGFPLTAADGTAIGTVCCLDSRSHDVTRAQYRTMESFACSASRVVQHHAGDK